MSGTCVHSGARLQTNAIRLFAVCNTGCRIARVGDFTDDLPRKRIGDPAQLDSTLLYLAAPASEFVTGTIVKVDDGQFPR
jgi:NAD(P)-dependent dehydrogenase (short-subunit alcohol dehydrogenase family)